MNAVIKDENPRKGLSAGFSSRRRVFRNCSGLRFVPHGHGRAAIPGQQHGALKCPCGQPRGHVQEAGDQCSCRCWSRGYLSNHNFIEVVKVGNMNVYRINSRVAWQGKRGERFAAFNAEILAESEQPEGFDTLPPLKSVPQPRKGNACSLGTKNFPARPTGNGSAMSLPLPPECWPLQLDDVVVLIEGVAFIETKEEAARLVAEGKARYPEWNPDDGDYDIEP